MKFLVANWKSHKTITEAVEWMRIFTSFNLSSLSQELTIILCPSFPLLGNLLPLAQTNNIVLGAQNISSFSSGPHTGEVSGENLSGLARFVIIGHSERRQDQHEDEEMIQLKIDQARSFAIEPIVCVHSKTTTNYDVDILVFETPEDIGSGHLETAEYVADFKQKLEKKPKYFLYGGSVTSENANYYLDNHLVDGFLVGTNSLDPLSFFAIAKLF